MFSLELFLSTLSLRRATHKTRNNCIDCCDFYPRSPCGERPTKSGLGANSRAFLSTLSLRRATVSSAVQSPASRFLSTLSLRRATVLRKVPILGIKYFYPRSPCGERLKISFLFRPPKKFLSTLSLRRATNKIDCYPQPTSNFYPRSPCGERHNTANRIAAEYDFYPRSPCGERLVAPLLAAGGTRYFYPRSPCGERLASSVVLSNTIKISIHALLAESDPGKIWSTAFAE